VPDDNIEIVHEAFQQNPHMSVTRASRKLIGGHAKNYGVEDVE
jgi:hypothetical protein